MGDRTRDTFGVAAFLLPLTAVSFLVAAHPVPAGVAVAAAAVARYYAVRPSDDHAVRRGPVREVRRWLHAADLETATEDDVTVEFYRRHLFGGVVVTRIYHNPEESP